VNQIINIIAQNIPNVLFEVLKWVTNLPVLVALLIIWKKKDFKNYKWLVLVSHIRIAIGLIQQGEILIHSSDEHNDENELQMQVFTLFFNSLTSLIALQHNFGFI
jgi:hypothetical protein